MIYEESCASEKMRIQDPCGLRISKLLREGETQCIGRQLDRRISESSPPPSACRITMTPPALAINPAGVGLLATDQTDLGT